MITNTQIKFVRSLSQQKYRKAHNAYLVEGDKIAKEYLSSALVLQYIFATEEFIATNQKYIAKHHKAKLITVQPFELEKISSLNTPHNVVLVVNIPPPNPIIINKSEWTLMLDTVQDPGNVGTILRIADWFGVHQVILSEKCADIYNPKVVQSSMGALIRVNATEANLTQVLSNNSSPIYGALLQGTNIKSLTQSKPGIIVLGNESKGISEALLPFITHPLTIVGKGGAESLNVAVAAGIICYTLVE